MPGSVRLTPAFRLAPALLATLLLSAAHAGPPPPTGLGLEWSPGELELILVADMTSDPGLEFLGVGATNVVGMYGLSTGVLIATLPAEFHKYVNYFPRDVDGDGLAELVCIYPDGNSPNFFQLGLLDTDGGLHRVWPTQLLEWGFTALEVVNFSANEPHALVVINTFMSVISPATGAVLYDTYTDPDLDPAYRVTGYELDTPGRVRLRIFDTAGRLVRTVVDGYIPAGSQQALWNGRDDNERDVASGIYFYELDVAGQRQTRKLVQVR